MKKIKINFVDFWESFNPESNMFMGLLRQRYEVELSEQPDFLVYSVFGKKHLQYDCVRIFLQRREHFSQFQRGGLCHGF